MKKLVIILSIFVLSMTLIGCGGGGGGGATDPVNNQPVGTTISQSASVRDLIARDFSDKYRMLSSRYTEVNASQRLSMSIRALTETTTGVGQKTVTYGPEDIISVAGVNYTYTSGSQKIRYLDASGNPTDNKSLVVAVEIENNDLKCKFVDGGDNYSMTYNGKLILSGMNDKNSSSVETVKLSASGMINAYHSIQWTSTGKVTVDTASFPYPTNGSSETGTMVIDDQTYNFSITYNGSKDAAISFDGAENLVLQVDLAAGDATGIVSNNLETAYPELFNAYKSMQTALQDNNKSAADRIALFGVHIADDFVDTSGNANKKQELLDSTESRLERYTVNSYSFTPGSFLVVNATTIEVTTDMFIDVTRKPGATGAVSAASIPLNDKKVIWKKYGTTWKIYQGIPYKSSEIGI